MERILLLNTKEKYEHMFQGIEPIKFHDLNSLENIDTYSQAFSVYDKIYVLGAIEGIVGDKLEETPGDIETQDTQHTIFQAIMNLLVDMSPHFDSYKEDGLDTIFYKDYAKYKNITTFIATSVKLSDLIKEYTGGAGIWNLVMNEPMVISEEITPELLEEKIGEFYAFNLIWP